jgi:energy-coupling factor transporter ATP-binding protein EcfA2
MKSRLDAFNAKHLKNEDIARTFVSSQLFLETAKNEHTILVGPRGSGKTTFLRMLSINTLPKWEGSNDLNIKYEGIYVPGDLVWGEMIKSLECVGLTSNISEAFAYSAFFTHVMLCTLDSIESSLILCSNELLQKQDRKIQSAFLEVCEILKLKPEKVSLSRIRHELVMKLNILGEYSRKISVVGSEQFSHDEFEEKVPYAYSDLKMTTESVLVTIDRALERPEHRWALLLDEFEIAPKYLLDKVISSMRSAAPKVLFKVALVPCGFHQEIKTETSAINDYSIVELWYVKKGESNSFCSNLIKSKFGISNPISRLGSTKFGSRISSNSLHWIEVFDDLFEKDRSFKSFILSKKINYKKEFSSDEAVSSLIRKISPIVAFRNAFINKNGTRKGRRSLPEFYAGWEAISTISEGNPRWLLSVLNPLLTEGSSSKPTDSSQMNKVEGSTNAYAAMLKTLPLSDNMGLSTKQPIFELLEKIGRYFNSRLIDERFQTSSKSTFTVDKNIPKDVEAALMIAWNYGAIVSVDSENTFGTYDSLQGMRFRLSYLLSPKFELNLTTGTSIILSTILASTKARVQNVTENELPSKQQDLFL